MEKHLLVGNRVPMDYFVTAGQGESDIAVHAGSYHLALRVAGIERCNILTYSSILPAIATPIEKPDLQHGAVMETIMAVAHADAGQQAAAGIIYGWLYDRETGDKYGGLVCEHNGCYDEKELSCRLKASLNELYVNGFDEPFELRDVQELRNVFVPEKRYGTALVALCFTSYVYPVLDDSCS